MGDLHYNGSINALEHAYTLVAMANAPSTFQHPTQYAFRYDGLGRMTHADGIQGDMVASSTEGTDPLFRVGDESYTFDRIGNMRNVQRHGHFTATPTGVEQLVWYYQLGAGTSRLQTVLAGTGSALGSRTYTYDPSGNLYTDAWRERAATTTGRAQLPFAVDLATDGGHRAEYLYDAADQRVYKQYATDEDDVLTSAFQLRDAGGRELGVLELAGEGGEATGEWTWYAFAQQRFA